MIGRISKPKYVHEKTNSSYAKDISLIKIRVFDVVNDDGFLKENWRGIKRFELRPIELPNAEMGIGFCWTTNALGCGDCTAQQIEQLPPLLNEEDGTFPNRSPSWIYDVYGSDNKRYVGCTFERFPMDDSRSGHGRISGREQAMHVKERAQGK